MISIIGTGRVGRNTAYRLAEKELGDIMMVDIIEGLPQGEALDMLHSSKFNAKITGTNNHKDISGSELVIVSAGIARNLQMKSRLELIEKNTKTIQSVSKQILEYAPKSKVIVVTNPSDIMTYLTVKTTGFERNRIVGLSGMLDSSRFIYYLSKELDCSPSGVKALVIGEHGNSMVPLISHATANSIPVRKLLSEERIKKVIERVQGSGAELIGLKGSTFYAPSVAVAEMAEAIIKDKKAIMPASVYLEGEYGINDACIGVPVKLGKDGVEQIIELDLDDDEKQQFNESAKILKEKISNLNYADS